MNEKDLEIYRGFGERIAKARKQQKLSQKELADKLGIAQSTLAGYETGARKVTFGTLQEISNTLNITVDYLFGKTDNPNEYVLEESFNGALEGSVEVRATMEVTAHENQVIVRYRKADEPTQKIIDKILDIPE